MRGFEIGCLVWLNESTGFNIVICARPPGQHTSTKSTLGNGGFNQPAVVLRIDPSFEGSTNSATCNIAMIGLCTLSSSFPSFSSLRHFPTAIMSVSPCFTISDSTSTSDDLKRGETEPSREF